MAKRKAATHNYKALLVDVSLHTNTRFSLRKTPLKRKKSFTQTTGILSERGRVAGPCHHNPAPSEPDVPVTWHPAQASHKPTELVRRLLVDGRTGVAVAD